MAKFWGLFVTDQSDTQSPKLSTLEYSLAKLVRIMLYASPVIMVGILIGTAIFVGSNPQSYTPRDLSEVGIRTTGVVVGYAESMEQGETAYAPVIEFKTSLGATIMWPSDLYSSSPRYRLGDEVIILYDPQTPDRARIISE